MRRGYNQTNVVYTIFTIDTTKITTGGSDNKSIRLPFFNFAGTVDYDDGTVIDYPYSSGSVVLTHSYLAAGIYNIKVRIIEGNYTQFYYINSLINDRSKLIEVLKWGKLYLGSGSFYSCNNINLDNVIGFPILTSNPINAFRSSGVGFINGLNLWDFSVVLNASNMFTSAISFNQDLSVLDFNKDIDLTNFMVGKSSANYSASNYSKLLIKVRNAVVGTGRTQTIKNFTMQNIKYDSSGASARADLIADGWSILDGGLV